MKPEWTWMNMICKLRIWWFKCIYDDSDLYLASTPSRRGKWSFQRDLLPKTSSSWWWLSSCFGGVDPPPVSCIKINIRWHHELLHDSHGVIWWGPWSLRTGIVEVPGAWMEGSEGSGVWCCLEFVLRWVGMAVLVLFLWWLWLWL